MDIDSSASFAALIRAASLPVLVDFWVPWCGPCQMVAPEVAKVAAGEWLVVKANTEAQPGIAGSMGIRSIPTFTVFTAGHEAERTSGALPAAKLRAFALGAANQSEARR